MSRKKEPKKDMYLIWLPEQIRAVLEQKKAETKLPIKTLILTAIKIAVESNWGEQK